jgi:hypothetical protein
VQGSHKASTACIRGVKTNSAFDASSELRRVLAFITFARHF